MAFFSNSHTHDSQLRRKRSTSTTRDRPSRSSTGDSSPGEVYSQRRSPGLSASPSSSSLAPESHEPAPPLPTPLTAGPTSRSRVAVPSGTSEISPDYDQSTTPIPFIKPSKRSSPPQSFSLTIDVRSAKSANLGPSSSNEAVMPLNKTSPTMSSKGAASSPMASRPVPDSSSANNTPVRPVDPPLDSHPVSTDHTCGLVSPCIPPVERHRPTSSQATASMPPSKHSPTRKRNSETEAIALPTPVSPPGRRRAKPESIPIPPPSPSGRPHSRSQSATNSPNAHTSGSHPGSTKSSIKRVPVPMIDQDLTGAASGTRSASASGKSTPTHEPATSKQPAPRTRNVLRKRSITGTNRRHEAGSAPTSDSEKKTKSHRPHAENVMFSSSSRRDSSGPILDVSQPLPMTIVPDLTPAKEILVAYKRSHRDSFSQDKSLHSSGRVVAVGSEEGHSAGSLRSPWSSGWKSGQKDERSADERDTGEKETGTRGLRRKFSGKWGSSRRHESKRSVSENAPEVSERRQARDIEAKRSVTLPVDPRVNASPTSGKSPGRESQHDAVEGRVWEENVGDWVGKYMRGTEIEEKEVSNSRRLWRLVKRLSSGSLREKIIPPVGVPPPVPPLPKDLTPPRQRDTGPGDADGLQGGEMPIQHSVVPETSGGIMRFISSAPSLSIPRSNTVSGLGARQTSAHRRSEADSGVNPLTPVASRTNTLHRSVTTGTTPQMRRSATTRSSSPSSETTKFFSRSRTSSSSSYGDASVPPMPSVPPPTHIGKHAISPREHHNDRTENGEDKARVERLPSGRNPSTSVPASRESPMIPFFEARNAMNKFLPYKGRRATVSSSPTTHFPDYEPIEPPVAQARGTQPPIPQRNPRRPGHHSVSIPALPLSVQQHAMPNVIPIQDLSESEAMDEDATRPKQRPDSSQTPAVAKVRPRSISDGAIILEPERRASMAKSTLTFREMTTTQRQLTEQEKNAKWEDLLERSDKAGGTLHVGSPITGGLGLWSDRSSVALSETSETPPD